MAPILSCAKKLLEFCLVEADIWEFWCWYTLRRGSTIMPWLHPICCGMMPTQEANLFQKWQGMTQGIASDEFPFLASREKKIELIELQASEGRSSLLAINAMCRRKEG